MMSYENSSRYVELPKLNLEDKDDLGILAAARCGGASILVTGDKELQKLGQFGNVKILSPRQFWQELTA
jgi:predicted nucleic acid-binding protein